VSARGVTAKAGSGRANCPPLPENPEMTLSPKQQYRVTEGVHVQLSPHVTEHFQMIEEIKLPQSNWLDKVMWALGLVGGATILCAIFG
jgi:hypothetical protein